MSRLLASGSLRVDARRAVEKLREHRLLDLHQYALEIVRAGVAFGAAAIDVRFDADDLCFDFAGVPAEGLSAAALPRLLDHVLDEGEGPRPLRLLALSVNTALGIDPAWVEVAVGRARVRWTPALLRAGELPEAGEAAEALPAGALRVAVRRRLGWGVVRAAALGGVPREIELLAAALHEARAPVTLAGAPFPRTPRAPALVRVPFSAPGARRAFVEIVAATTEPSVLDWLELGALLLRAPLAFGAGDADVPGLPVRAVVDADALPTNASRSALREDAPLGRLAVEGAFRGFLEGLAALGAATCPADGAASIPEGVEILPADVAVREDALGQVAVAVAAAVARGGTVPEPLRAALDLPLLRDGHGRPLALSAVQPDAGGAVPVWRGEHPLPEDLLPWTRHVVWARGRVVERALAAFSCVDAGPLIEHARAGAERRRRLLARPPVAVALPASTALADALSRVGFEVREGELAGLHGEVAVLPGAVGPRKIHAFVDGHLLETVPLDDALVPLPIEAAIGWEGRLAARPGYDGIEPDQAFRRAVLHAVLIAVLAVEQELDRAARDEAAVDRLRPLARAAIGARAVTAARLGLADVALPPLSAFRRLHTTPLWPTTDPASPFVSTQAFGVAAVRCFALAAARPGAAGRAPDGRPVLAAGASERAWLAMALSDLPVVPYDGALLAPGEEEGFAARRDQALRAALGPPGAALGPVMRFERPGRRGFVAASDVARLAHAHAGKVLGWSSPPELARLVFVHDGGAAEVTSGERSRAPWPSPAASPHPPRLAVLVDDDAFVPTPAWDGLARRAAVPLGEIDRAYVERVIAALEGEPEAQRELGLRALDEAPAALRLLLLDRAQRYRKTGAAAAALAARLARLPLITMLDAAGRPAPASLLDLAHAHPTRVPFLVEPPGFETLGWRPLLAPSEEERALIAAWTGPGHLALADGELPSRLLRAHEERDRLAFLAAPALDPRDLGDLAEPDAPTVFLPWERLTVAAALAREAEEGARARAEILYQSRAVCVGSLPLELPVVARVDLADQALVRDFHDVADAAVPVVVAAVRAAARQLVLAAIERSDLFADLRLLRLAGGLLEGAPADDPLRAVLRGDTVLWPMVQGDARALWTAQRPGGEHYLGSARHLPWIGPDGEPTELDAPVLFVPATAEGDALRALLERLEARPRDVTAALAGLQARRAADAPHAVPRLAGAPAHPALRIEIGPKLRGELEIWAGPESEIHLVDLAGERRAVAARLPFPVRAVAQVDTLARGAEADHAHAAWIAQRALQLLTSLAPRFEELPDFVRAHLRAVLCQGLGNHKRIARGIRAAKVFQDVSGAWLSFDDLRAGPRRGCTHDPPPYPASAHAEGVLRLTDREMRALATEVELLNLTTSLRRELEGERRAAGPQVARVELDPPVRARCRKVVPLDEGGLEGEVGLLAHGGEGLRGIQLFVTRRPLCRLEDGEGWPVAAAVEYAAAPVNRAFDGLRKPAAATKVREAVRAAASRALAPEASPREEVEEVEVLPASEPDPSVPDAPATDLPTSAAPDRIEERARADLAPAEAEVSWWDDLWGAVRSFLGADGEPVETPLTRALHGALDRLMLTGQPVRAVGEVRHGRPIRYDADERRLTINPRHEALAWLRPQSPIDRRDVALLAAAAVSEINRELLEVTDDEERDAVLRLLRELGE